MIKQLLPPPFISSQYLEGFIYNPRTPKFAVLALLQKSGKFCNVPIFFHCLKDIDSWKFYCTFVFLYICISVFLSFCSSVLLYFCTSVLLYFCISVFLYFCISVFLYLCTFYSVILYFYTLNVVYFSTTQYYFIDNTFCTFKCHTSVHLNNMLLYIWIPYFCTFEWYFCCVTKEI